MTGSAPQDEMGQTIAPDHQTFAPASSAICRARSPDQGLTAWPPDRRKTPCAKNLATGRKLGYQGSTATRALPAGAVLAVPAACPQADFAGATVLVGNVDCAQTSFAYNAAVAQRNGILALTLVLTQAASAGLFETISLYQEVQVDNTP